MDWAGRARRAFLARAVASSAAGLAACAGVPDRSSKLTCSPGQTLSDLSAPLTIDTHAHVFNGCDLQVEAFLSQVVTNSERSELRGIVRFLGGILQFVNWNLAPTARDEVSLLAGVPDLLQACGVSQSAQIVDARRAGYETGRKAIVDAKDAALRARAVDGRALARSPLLEDRRLAALHVAIDDLLPPDYDDWRRRRAVKAEPASRAELAPLRTQETITGYLDFVLHHFYYRHANVLDYLETYSLRSARKIDLLVPSLVDFDWWLAKGRRTPSSLADQVAVMERISIITGGRVHGFVAFCPFRDLMTNGESLALVKEAVENRGFIGVKLYPPMGFAPYGNCGLDVWRNKPILPEAAQNDRGFGCKLDGRMKALFEWCRKNDVPVMAHTNHSNGPYADFEDLAGAPYWEAALRAFPGLRVSFGHFGDSDAADDNGERVKAFMQLMSAEPGSTGEHLYADSGFFADALTQAPALGTTLAALYGSDSASLIAKRFMYGTDWEMLLTQKDVDGYLQSFIEIMKELDSRPGRAREGMANAFFGGNATNYLGLAQGHGARRRLEAFYRRHAVKRPDWMAKVDAA